MRSFGMLSFLLAGVLIQGCSLLKKAPDGSSPARAILLDTMELDIQSSAAAPYQIAPTKKVDVLHMELDISFNWEQEAVNGIAKLHVSGFAAPKDSVYLNARGFEIHAISQILKDTVLPSLYTYANNEIGIALQTKLSPKDTILIEIKYTARPSELVSADGTAITSDQGLYFINPSGETDQPQQIWTQGEPESNSAWFPCVDHPYEKITHEIFITTDEKFHAISNGELVYQEINPNKTVTTYWKQNKPHAVYLVMLAVGEFALATDSWNDIPVHYYLDKEYLEYATDIFGNTPEMLGFYSDLLDYPYPWEKYHQIVVKDFVSGAMENTSAVIHGDFVQLTDRELLDNSHEDVIAHELFHHWFGDLVTCESWTQLTLNEGFATYGEYLWKEHKYGLEEARLHLQSDLDAYISEASYTPKHLIRHYYNTPDDVFDTHTYQKGGRVLHMLRLELGDSVFFKSLNIYLREHQYGSVELADLRQAVEKTSGRDMQWFFDQWFVEKGHPQVEATLIDTNGFWLMALNQVQSEDWPTFQFHLPYSKTNKAGETSFKNFWMTTRMDTILLGSKKEIEWFELDPFGDMLWEVDETKTSDLWKAQAVHANSFISRENALISLYISDSAQALNLAEKMLEDEFWLMRQYGTDLAVERDSVGSAALASLIELSQLDPKSSVRSAAFIALDSLSPDYDAIKSLYLNGLKDQSYQVVRTCLQILTDHDPCTAAENLNDLATEKRGGIPSIVGRVYAQCPKLEYLSFFETNIPTASNFEVYLLGAQATSFAVALNNEDVYESLANSLVIASESDDSWWARHAAIQFIQQAQNYLDQQIEEIEEMTEATINEMERLSQLRQKKADWSFELMKLEKTQAETPPPFSR